MQAKDRIIVALDTPTLAKAKELAAELKDHVGAFKVGLELLTSEGAPNVIKNLGGRLFFDGKFKDIPNTVAGAVRGVTNLGAWMLNVHCLGGVEMMKRAVGTAKEVAGDKRPLVIGVTILTSLDAKAMNDIGIAHIKDDESLKNMVVHLSLKAKEAGLDGVVASPREIKAIRDACGKDFLIVTPGVRPTWVAKGDQKRVTTPKEALAAGADYLVIGRPITNPPAEVGSPADAAKKIATEMS